MTLIIFLALIAYVGAGVVMYCNDVFDDTFSESETGELVPALTFALIGGAVITLRVFRLASSVLFKEFNKAFPGLILVLINAVESVFNFAVDSLKAIWRGVCHVGREIKREMF